MNNAAHIVEQLKDLLRHDRDLYSRLQQHLQHCAKENPDSTTNPVHSLDDLYSYMQRFLISMPWGWSDKVEMPSYSVSQESKKENITTAGLFRRIDQATGYFYYLFGNLQYEPPIADWLHHYNVLWGEFLSSTDSWNNEYLEMIKSDPLFELNTDKYESPDHWHCWNDFFSRKLRKPERVKQLGKLKKTKSLETISSPAEGCFFGWTKISEDSTLPCNEPVKTTDIFDIKTLLGNSPYRNSFADGQFGHIVLDIYNYHRFHSPVNGKIVDIQDIDGQLSAGGRIIWDALQHRYRYSQLDNIGYQMIEKRMVIIIAVESQKQKEECQKWEVESGTSTTLIALIPIGVAQVGSIRLNEDISIGEEIRQHQELGYFLCGGSDVIILTN